MNRLIAFGAALLLGMPGAAVAQDQLKPETLKAAAAFQAAFRSKDCAAGLAPARTIIADPGLQDSKRVQLYHYLVACEDQLGRDADAYQDVLKATGLLDANEDVWQIRFRLEMKAANYPAAVATIEQLAQESPSILSSFDPRWLGSFYYMLDQAKQDALSMRVLKVLSTAYVPADPAMDVDGFRAMYASRLIGQHKQAEARPILDRITHLAPLIAIALDKDSRDLRAPVDFAALAHQQLLDDQAALAANPQSLGALMAVSQDLRRLGRYQAALELLNTAKDRVNDSTAFRDRAQYINWWWNQRAEIYEYLGDYPHMLESFQAGIAAGENGGANVSQLLNLAEAQVRFGRYDEALATLAPAEKGARSPYGTMIYYQTHGCAAFKAGKKDVAATDVAYVRAHEKDASGAAQTLLTCVGDIDGAVAVLIRRLDDSNQRVAALRDLSNYTPDPATRPLFPGEEKLEQIKARPDVKAAIARAGGLVTFPFQGGVM